jgi:hypothetical protein
MSSTKPRHSWSEAHYAEVWLRKFIHENLGPRYQGLSSDPVLFDRVFKEVPTRWSTFYDLRKRFEDDLDSLTAFIEEFLTKRKGRG